MTEWYIQSHVQGIEQPIALQKIMSVLSAYKVDKSNDYVEITLPDGDVVFYMDMASGEVSHITIERPIHSNDLNRIVYEIMQYGNFILYATDGEFPIILDEATAKELPDDMLDALGEPRLAENLASFSSLLNEMYGG